MVRWMVSTDMLHVNSLENSQYNVKNQLTYLIKHSEERRTVTSIPRLYIATIIYTFIIDEYNLIAKGGFVRHYINTITPT